MQERRQESQQVKVVKQILQTETSFFREDNVPIIDFTCFKSYTFRLLTLSSSFSYTGQVSKNHFGSRSSNQNLSRFNFSHNLLTNNPGGEGYELGQCCQSLLLPWTDLDSRMLHVWFGRHQEEQRMFHLSSESLSVIIASLWPHSVWSNSSAGLCWKCYVW